eukprot:GHVR01089021.1.p1 GENE.GHVR01089021.1~~GHVR01089021.1.p1  ORF type:complete len:104 (+),score=36.64 GHVR01089021.1:109-420(+)
MFVSKYILVCINMYLYICAFVCQMKHTHTLMCAFRVFFFFCVCVCVCVCDIHITIISFDRTDRRFQISNWRTETHSKNWAAVFKFNDTSLILCVCVCVCVCLE